MQLFFRCELSERDVASNREADFYLTRLFKGLSKSTVFRMCTIRQNLFICTVSSLFFCSGPFIYSSDAVIKRKSEVETTVWLKAVLLDRGDA